MPRGSGHGHSWETGRGVVRRLPGDLYLAGGVRPAGPPEPLRFEAFTRTL